jgi:hypothetical protein
MAFGQQSGPPASARQIERLLGLLQAAGHDGFRDARGPLRFTQRQAAGKFTRDEATTFIDLLEQAEHSGDLDLAAQRTPLSATEQAVRRLPTEQLAAELQRRGWVVVQP